MDKKEHLLFVSQLLGNADKSAALPMIVPLHFMGSSPAQILPLLLHNFDTPARVIAPYGLHTFETQFAWFPEDLYAKSEAEQAKFLDSVVTLLLENTAVWMEKFPTVGKPIYLGVSQGGDLCFTLAAKHSDQFSLCLPIAGRLLTDEIVPQENPGIVRAHQGQDDPIVSVESARTAVEQLRAAQLDVELREYAGVEHAVPPEMRAAIHTDIRTTLETLS
mgnify:CR=1 FL=1